MSKPFAKRYLKKDSVLLSRFGSHVFQVVSIEGNLRFLKPSPVGKSNLSPPLDPMTKKHSLARSGNFSHQTLVVHIRRLLPRPPPARFSAIGRSNMLDNSFPQCVRTPHLGLVVKKEQPFMNIFVGM